jgi:hypothetical protein
MSTEKEQYVVRVILMPRNELLCEITTTHKCLLLLCTNNLVAVFYTTSQLGLLERTDEGHKANGSLSP